MRSVMLRSARKQECEAGYQLPTIQIVGLGATL
jgi:hypothetical protein